MNENGSKNSSLTVNRIAEILGGSLTGDIGKAEEIFRVAALEKAQKNEIAFVEKDEINQPTDASCLLVPESFSSETACPQIKVKNPKLAFAKIAAVLYAPKKRKPQIHSLTFLAETAVISPSAFIAELVKIGENSVIGENTQILSGAKIGDNVRIGDNCVVHANCVIYDNSTIGSNVILHAGVVIGADGFGYVRDGASGYVKFPQIGTVIIEDDVEIGANSCIDRGALGATRIGRGTKIDNLVQIAHNVDIGERVVIASQTGISGSTVIEDDCVIGGQVGFGDHARVLKGAIIGSKAGILPGKIVREGIWWGIPVQPLAEYKRQNAMVKGLSRMREEIKILKKELESLKNKG